MGSKEIIPVNKITERMLPPHLRRRAKKVASKIILETKFDASMYDTFTAAESISEGNAVHIASDGLAYKANNTSNKSANGFAAADAATGETVYMQTSRQITISSASFTVGSKAFLSSGAINVTTTVPTLSNNYLLQRLGTAISSTVIQIEIEEVKTAII